MVHGRTHVWYPGVTWHVCCGCFCKCVCVRVSLGSWVGPLVPVLVRSRVLMEAEGGGDGGIHLYWKVISEVSPFGVHEESFETCLLSGDVVDTARNKAGEDSALTERVVTWRRQRGDK